MSETSIPPPKSCFVIMPISDPTGYDSGHFKRVYEHIIQPACTSASLNPTRADDVKSANHIILDILQRIVTADLVICDLSSKNANVMYELGIRQAFNLPVVLIKDQRTERVFDIQGLRTVDYDENLRIDCVNKDIENIRQAINATMKPQAHDINSLVKLLSIRQAELPKSGPVSEETSLILASIRDLSERLTQVERLRLHQERSEDQTPLERRYNISSKRRATFLPNGEDVNQGDEIFDGNGNLLGKFVSINARGVILGKPDGIQFIVPPDTSVFEKLTTIPF